MSCLLAAPLAPYVLLLRPQVAVGRQDAAAADPDGRMPELDFSAEQQLANFAAKGLSAQEFVVLSGSHTVSRGGWLGWSAPQTVWMSLDGLAHMPSVWSPFLLRFPYHSLHVWC